MRSYRRSPMEIVNYSHKRVEFTPWEVLHALCEMYPEVMNLGNTLKLVHPDVGLGLWVEFSDE